MRVLIALGGNAMAGPDGRVRPVDQIGAAQVAMGHVADLVAAGVEVVLTHGNGPQVGNLLVKNEIAASVVPPVPLDWCVAQTQATLGFVLMNALDDALTARGVRRDVATVVTRVVVDADDPGFSEPTKPIGRYLSADEAHVLMGHGETWEDRGQQGWRRVVASPEPREVLDAAAVQALVGSGFVVVANGGGGVPVVREPTGLRGVEAVVDKDLAAAVLARAVEADALVIATDVPHVMVGFGTPDQRPLEQVTLAQMREHQRNGEFARGSMGPKVEAVLRFVEGGGQAAVCALDDIARAVDGEAGTIVTTDQTSTTSPTTSTTTSKES